MKRAELQGSPKSCWICCWINIRKAGLVRKTRSSGGKQISNHSEGSGNTTGSVTIVDAERKANFKSCQASGQNWSFRIAKPELPVFPDFREPKNKSARTLEQNRNFRFFLGNLDQRQRSISRSRLNPSHIGALLDLHLHRGDICRG